MTFRSAWVALPFRILSPARLTRDLEPPGNLSVLVILVLLILFNDVIDRLEAGIYMYMQASICRRKHIYVDESQAYTGRCFPLVFHLSVSSICICFSSGVPEILPYVTNQSCFSGFHRPPAAFACALSSAPFRTLRYGEEPGCQKRIAGVGRGGSISR